LKTSLAFSNRNGIVVMDEILEIAMGNQLEVIDQMGEIMNTHYSISLCCSDILNNT